MKPFLYTVATQLNARHKGHMHQLAVVFPNRRQAVFMQHYLQQILEPPCFLPQLLTIEELVAASSAWPVADSLTQSFALYEAFAAVSAEEGDSQIPSFDVFFNIGETLLKDFSELNSYLADIGNVCQVLYDYEAIDKSFNYLSEEQLGFLKTFWKGTKDRSFIQDKFLTLWQRLPLIYQRFLEILEQKGLTTLGKVYEQLARGLPGNTQFAETWQHIAFVGFNAFNKAEETFIKIWNDTGFATLWFDADEWYINQPQQEAGYFLRRNLQVVGLKNELEVGKWIANRQNPITVCAVEGQYAMAKQVAPWYENVNSERPLQVGILLADESLLLPTLQSLPPALQSVNVTMGYPFQQSAVYSLVQLFFEIQANLSEHKYQSVAYSLVEKWLQHPFCDWPLAASDKMAEYLAKQMELQVPVKLMQKYGLSADLLFGRMMGDMEVFQKLRQILEMAMRLPVVQQNSMLEGLSVAGWRTLQQLEQLFASLKPQPEMGFMQRLLLKQLGSISVPFEGEPLSGLQIMGLLESRGLDFDQLIVLGANEGSLPRIKPPDSFLPHNIRRAFGLPVPEHQDAIFAYVFYRLLHRSDAVTLVYNSLITDNSTGELTRFVQQLQFESHIPIITQSKNMGIQPQLPKPIVVHKSPDVINKLQLYLGANAPKPLSPSAINTYLQCRLQFFFKYIANLKMPEALDDSVQAAAVGKVVHKLMELLHLEWMRDHGKEISKEAIAWMQEKKTNLIAEAFRLVWKDREISGSFTFSGQLLVVKEIVLQYVDYLLALDLEIVPFTIEQLEVKMQQPFGFAYHGRSTNSVLKGYIDRIDSKAGVYRMVDYKTGSDNPAFASMDDLFEPHSKKGNKAALQTLLYTWMFQKTFPEKKNIEPVLLAVRHTITGDKGEDNIYLYHKHSKEPLRYHNINAYLVQTEEMLRRLLQELFESDQPFDQTPDTKTCKYCDFNSICNR
jgi:hypothetical protein